MCPGLGLLVGVQWVSTVRVSPYRYTGMLPREEIELQPGLLLHSWRKSAPARFSAAGPPLHAAVNQTLFLGHSGPLAINKAGGGGGVGGGPGSYRLHVRPGCCCCRSHAGLLPWARAWNAPVCRCVCVCGKWENCATPIGSFENFRLCWR